MTQHTIVLDTFQYAKDLQKAGFTEIQVETQVKYAKEQAKNLSEWIDDNLATKQDIKALGAEIKLSEERTGKSIAQMGYKTIAVLGGMIAASVTILGFLIKL
ncbi:MAG: hypothetical protein ACD_21C00120G0002 [uncultured bacterium]|nr:MAG: hypothetical protein ACD_21C00120G0002 [uncultured bacterium]